MQFLLVKVPKNNEYTPASAYSMFSSLFIKPKSKGIVSLFSKSAPLYFSFDIISLRQNIYFVIGATENSVEHLKNQFLAQYQKADVSVIDFNLFLKDIDVESLEYSEVNLANNNYYPIKTYEDLSDNDPILGILSAMSRSPDPKAFFWFQMIAKPSDNSWQNRALSKIASLSSAETISQSTQQKIALIQQKLKHNGFYTNIRLVADSPVNLNAMYSAFTIFTLPNGNSFTKANPGILKKKRFIQAVLNHDNFGTSNLLNISEITSIWHMPPGNISIPNIQWGKSIQLDSPEELPFAYEGISDEEKKDITFIGKTMYKNRQVIFGIKSQDRQRHFYVVGKTGTGKSALLMNMAIEDIRKGYGLAFLDPHGDAIDTIMQYIPKNRINDVCYFNPSDPEYTYPLNILEVHNESQKELMVSGIIAIFYKLYSYSWGPRLEHILRNVLFTLVYTPNATLPDVMSLLHDQKYRNRILADIDDPMLIQFWKKEYDAMSDKFRDEAIAPILNKVGQFVSSPLIRRIIQHPKSKVKIEDMMNNKKIFLCDLSQGKIGEDNAALLGAMLITQIQVAAMNRAFIPEADRVPFYLYVDEFQNFATSSFSKILSEARKYKLGLTLANQYITQIDEEVMNAILGNVGSLACFNVGAQDSERLYKEFGGAVDAEDLSNGLDKYQMIMRMMIGQTMSAPFTYYTLPLPKNISGHKEKIIEQSRKQFGLKLK